jgi:4-alpha-glucanotransferase
LNCRIAVEMDQIFERAAVWGLETDYRDAFGKMQAVEPAVLSRLLEAFPVQGPSARVVPRSVVFRPGAERVIRLDSPDGVPIHWALRSRAGYRAEGTAVSRRLTLPADLPDDVFHLDVTIGAPSDANEHAAVVVSPPRAYQGTETAPQRMWALALQLYSVRSSRNWGHGDFSDLLAAVDLAGDLGASGIALNPLHALFDDDAEQASPYSPSSRLFLNPLYIDVDTLPEFPGIEAAGLGDPIERLRAQSIVDYAGVADAKTRAMRLAYQAFLQSASADRRRAFEQFRRERGGTLARFAAFEVLRRKFNRPWWEWPEQWRHPDDDAVTRLRADEPDAGYFEFVQWAAHEQLERCRARAAERGLPIGLYLDVAVGTRSDGFDSWTDQGSFLPHMSIGAPPDILNTNGQNWGLTGFAPIGLEEQNFEPFRRMLEASMRYAGAIRLDHVLGLKRIYIIPAGSPPTQGAYVRYPFEALLAVTALASVQHGCIVIGEDLGTVPENFRETLADWGLWSYQVLLFERGEGGAFAAPETYREPALVSFATHDLPTFAGWKGEHDLATKEAIGINPGETVEERRNAHDAMRRALEQRGLGFDFASVARYLADTPSRLLVIAIEDVLQVAEQVNLPGTIDEHPNWRRRLPSSIEDWRNHAGLRDLAHILQGAGRGKLETPASMEQC